MINHGNKGEYSALSQINNRIFYDSKFKLYKTKILLFILFCYIITIFLFNLILPRETYTLSANGNKSISQ
jgi:hypothetical protein